MAIVEYWSEKSLRHGIVMLQESASKIEKMLLIRPPCYLPLRTNGR